MQKTQAEIARLANVTRLVISRYIAKHGIQPSGKKGKLSLYDCSQEPLAGYLTEAHAKQPHESSKRAISAQKCRSVPAEAAVRRASKPLNDLLAGKMPEGQKPAAFFFAEALKLAKENQDASLYFKLGQIAAKEEADETIRLQALKTEQAKEQIAQGQADRIRLENAIRRGEYMEKSVVKVLFGRVYAVHTSGLATLPLKLVSMLAAIPDGPGKEGAMKKLIDDEIFSALESIKRQLVEYVSG